MSRRLRNVAVVFFLALLAAQFVRPDGASPATDASRSIHAQLGTAGGLVAVLDRACNDCHSNQTVWPWYAQIAPLSWLMEYGVTAGRKALNFSDWAAYSPERQRALLAASCSDVSSGKMPGAPYTLLRPEAKLSVQDIEAVCAAARPVASTGGR
jgi:hypothetical protein